MKIKISLIIILILFLFSNKAETKSFFMDAIPNGNIELEIIFTIKEIEPPGIQNFSFDLFYFSNELKYDDKTTIFSEDLGGTLCCKQLEPEKIRIEWTSQNPYTQSIAFFHMKLTIQCSCKGSGYIYAGNLSGDLEGVIGDEATFMCCNPDYCETYVEPNYWLARIGQSKNFLGWEDEIYYCSCPVKWKVYPEDSNIISVDSCGTVTALAEGTARVYFIEEYPNETKTPDLNGYATIEVKDFGFYPEYFTINGEGWVVGTDAEGITKEINPALFPGQDIARDVEKDPNSGVGYYILDKEGVIHAMGGAALISGIFLLMKTPIIPMIADNEAIDLEISSDGAYFYILDLLGQVYKIDTTSGNFELQRNNEAVAPQAIRADSPARALQLD